MIGCMTRGFATRGEVANAGIRGMDYLSSTATTRNGSDVLTSCTTYFDLSPDRHIVSVRFEDKGRKAR